MIELYLVRHGETDLNVQKVYYGWTDCCMNSRGYEQAKELADILGEVDFDVVISSSLQRAVETATIISGFSADTIIKDDRLKELNFGDWEGVYYLEVQEKYREHWEKWGRDWKNASPPSGESYRELRRRVEECLGELLERYDGKKVLVVSHQGCLRIIPAILLGMGDDGYWNFTAEQGRYSLFEIENGHCTVKRLNSGR